MGKIQPRAASHILPWLPGSGTGAGNSSRNSLVGGRQGLTRQICPYPSPSQGHHGAGLLSSVARGPLREDNTPVSKAAARLAALCPGLGEAGTRRCWGLRGSSAPSRPELPPSAPPRPPEPLSQGAPCQHPVGKKPGRGLIASSCLQPLQFRGRGQDPNHLAVPAGGMCEITIPTQLKNIPSPAKSGSFPAAAPGEDALRGTAGSELSPFCPEPVGARSGWICGLISPVQKPRVFGRQ